MSPTAARHRARSSTAVVDRPVSRDRAHDRAHDLDPPGRPSSPRERRDRVGAQSHLVLLLAFASIGAGLIHAAVTPEHADWLPSAALFAALAAFQLAWGLLVLARPTRPVLGAGLALNLGAVGLWLLSRTAGMPFGPHKAEAEPFARTDVLATVLQVALVAAAAWLLCARRPARALPLRSLIPSGALGAVVAGIAVVALSGASGHAHAPGSADDGHGDHAPVPVSNTTPISPSGERPLSGITGDRAGKAAGAGDKAVPARADDGHLHEH